MAEAEVERASQVKFLGMNIIVGGTSRCLLQTSLFCNFAMRTLAKECHDRQAWIYHGLFMSAARYGLLAWGSTAKSMSRRPKNLQAFVVVLSAGRIVLQTSGIP